MNLQEDTQVHWYLREVASKNFKVGDYLIKYIFRHNTWAPCAIHEDTKQLRKYRVVHVDELGVPFLRGIKVSGGYYSAAVNLATITPNYERYELDPEYVDSMILETDYDPMRVIKDEKQAKQIK